MTIDYGWVSDSLRAAAQKRDGQISNLLGTDPVELQRLRRIFSAASAAGAAETSVMRRVGLPEKLFRWWRKLEVMPDSALDAEVDRVQGLIEQERAKRASARASRTGSRNERLGKPYVNKHPVTPRVYDSGPIPGWWHGGE